jgi:SpoVK/Ycf46/Vps4 family AAA+-type ATPase
MASGDLLRKLFQSHQRRDDQAFTHYARQIISEEREKHHHLLAADLERMLEGSHPRDSRRVPAVAMKSLHELPRDRERDSLLIEESSPEHGLEDIVLSDENRCVIEEILRETRRQDVLRTHRLRPRQRLLFCGPPGTGKSLCAEVVARELGLPLLTVRFDAVISSFLGETAANIRKVFDFATRGDWVLLFDDFDAIGKRRDDPTEHGELKRVVNSFLQLLDGFQSNNLVIAATNHEGLLDPALWRRFDEVLYFGRPSQDEIYLLLEVKLAAMRHQQVNLSRLVPKLSGMSHADIERVCHDAMRAAVLKGEHELSLDAIARAIQHHCQRLSIADGVANATSSAPIQLER